MEPSLVSILERFGFPVAMVAILLYGIRELIRRMFASSDTMQSTMLDVIRRNSEAMQKLSLVVEDSARTMDRLAQGFTSFEGRLLRLEKCQHAPGEGHDSCPLLDALNTQAK